MAFTLALKREADCNNITTYRCAIAHAPGDRIVNHRHGLASLALALGMSANAAHAAPPPPATALGDILGCRAQTDAGARLACFDAKSADLAAAQDRNDILVMNKAEMRKTRRSLFGLTLPSLDIFSSKQRSDKRPDMEDIDRLEDVVKSARQDSYGKWTIELSDGARWIQTDETMLVTDPRPGMKIVLKRAAVGSFFANIDGQKAIRMRRAL